MNISVKITTFNQLEIPVFLIGFVKVTKKLNDKSKPMRSQIKFDIENPEK